MGNLWTLNTHLRVDFQMNPLSIKLILKNELKLKIYGFVSRKVKIIASARSTFLNSRQSAKSPSAKACSCCTTQIHWRKGSLWWITRQLRHTQGTELGSDWTDHQRWDVWRDGWHSQSLGLLDWATGLCHLPQHITNSCLLIGMRCQRSWSSLSSFSFRLRCSINTLAFFERLALSLTRMEKVLVTFSTHCHLLSHHVLSGYVVVKALVAGEFHLCYHCGRILVRNGYLIVHDHFPYFTFKFN